jgi:preprotein translocase subunit SecA
MGKLYEFLGLSVEFVEQADSQARKRRAFAADITYTTALTLGFSFLAETSSVDDKDNLVREAHLSSPTSTRFCMAGSLAIAAAPGSGVCASD